MLINLKKIVKGDLKGKLLRLLDVPLLPSEVVSVSNLIVDVNRFIDGFFPHMKKQEVAYASAGRLEEFTALKAGFVNSDYFFPDIEPFTVSGYTELYDSVLDGIITFI